MESGLTSTLASFAPPLYVKELLLLVALAVLVTTIRISGVANANYAAGRIRDIGCQLRDEASLDSLRADLTQPTLRDAWRMRLEALIATLERWFGPRWSWRAFGLSLMIAAVYPILLYVVAWVAGASGSIGDRNILPNGLPFWRRAAILALGVGLTGFVAWWTRSGERLSRRVGASRLENAVVALVAPLVAAGAGAGALALAGASSATFVGVLGNLAVTVVFAFTGLSVYAIVFTMFIALAISVAGPLAYHVFFLILPLANGIFDFLSWLATRKLLERMTSERAGWRGAAWIVAEMLIDLALAALCLAGLAATMAFLLEGLNVFLASRGPPIVDWRSYSASFVRSGSPIFDWRAYIEASRALPALDPSNWMTVGMLASTVAPTALHLAAGLSCVATSFFGDGRALAGRIAPDLPEIARQKLAADIYGFQTKRSILFAVLAPIILIALLWLLWSTLGAWLPSLYDLADRSAAFWRR